MGYLVQYQYLLPGWYCTWYCWYRYGTGEKIIPDVPALLRARGHRYRYCTPTVLVQHQGFKRSLGASSFFYVFYGDHLMLSNKWPLVKRGRECTVLQQLKKSLFGGRNLYAL